MTNTIAIWVFVGLFVLAIVLGQLAHISPDGSIRLGLKVALVRLGSLLAAAHSSLTFLEVVKNLAQALLLSGPTLVNLFAWKMQLDEPTQLHALAVGLAVNLVLLAYATARLEKLRR